MANANGVWFKVHVFRDGNWLKARVHLVAAGEPAVFDVGVDMAKVLRVVKNYHERLHGGELPAIGGCIGCDYDADVGGLFSSIKKVTKKIGKTKLVRAVSNGVKKVVKNKIVQATAMPALAMNKKLVKAAGGIKPIKSVIKSKVTGALAGGLAVAFPPVGVPAAAAYAGANAALAAVERGQAIRKAAVAALKPASPKVKAQAKKVAVSTAKKAKVALNIAKKTTKAATKKKANSLVTSLVKKAKAAARVATGKPPAIADKTKKLLAKAVSDEKKAKAFIQDNLNKARYATDPAVKAEASKAVKILELVQQNRNKVAAIPTQGKTASRGTRRVKGLVVTETGKIVQGVFDENPLGKGGALLYRPGKSLPGSYTKVGGCIGCSSPWPALH